MTARIDVKFLVGLLVGALVTAVLAFLLAGPGDDGDGSSRASGNGPAATGDGGDPADKGQDDKRQDGDDRGGDDVFTPGPGFDLPVPDGEGKVTCPSPTKAVSDTRELEDALRSARPGDVIRMNAGTYEGTFVATTSGTARQPIFLCGGPDAVLDGGGIRKGYAFHLDKAAHWRLVGFTVRNSQKGVMADTTTGSIVQGLTVHDIGDEAIHLRNFSTRNTVQYNKIYNTGKRREKFGEGVYLGTAQSNWKQVSGGRVDNSDFNVVRGNVIRATAEAIDIKEGTKGGRIVGNVFDGSAMGGGKVNDSWVDVKGNGYLIEGNRGTGTLADGFQTHEIVNGWGTGNVFRRNIIDLAGGDGVGVNDTAGGNTVACDNKVTGGPLLTKGTCA
ncbi:nitrous oxide reductase family maturation protein NosD [Actinomadura sp. SCN-SB]|uniref:right-handed parallel beta-helix repeat-containing protein n=1 Tax=Actinomadura sp. SCN-SB TaxID=3373092 RepID=UPI0037527A6F